LDVSNNEHLTQLSAYVNPNLKSIDVSKLIQLEVLDLGDCDLTNLDVSQNVLLTKLFVKNNKLSTLDVSQNKQLMVLKCQNNQISNLKVSNNTFLETLDVSDNQLSALNVRSNTALKDFRMSNNINITAINLKNNVALETLYADGLSISEINLVENSAIKRLSLLDNENLTSLRSWQDFSDISTLISIDHVVVMTNPDASTQNFPLIGTRLVDAQEVSGVVFKCDDSSCYIMSQIYKYNVAWSTEEVTTGATNNSDGMVNMSYVKAKNPDLSKYPALKWCADYGSGWYLPALNELKTILSNRSTLNATLQKVNGKTLGTYTYYWSSTEASNRNVFILNIDNPNSDSYYPKSSTSAEVRAVRVL
jgi:hypothetical protein